MLQGKENLGKCRLQSIIVLLFIPHMFHIAYSVQAATPRELLVPIFDEFYGTNSTVAFGLHVDKKINEYTILWHNESGFIDVLAFEPAVALTYLIFVPVFSNNYIIYTRKNVSPLDKRKSIILATPHDE